MRFALRYRLLGSYILLLFITLSVITIGLLLLLRSRPAPPRITYDRLSAFIQGMNLSDLVIRSVQGQGQGPPRFTIAPESELDAFADSRSVRVMVLDISDGSPIVAYDSNATLEVGTELKGQIDGAYTNNRLTRALQQYRLTQQVHGSFMDADGTEWLFSGLASARPGQPQTLLILAEPNPLQTLGDTLAEYGSTLLRPLVQAAFIGVFAAIFLAIFISRTIARPLQAASRAATAVAQGDQERYVPISGPPEVRAFAEAFNRMSAEVRSTQQAQRDFLANVSHDLKTPLTSIQGYSQAIIDGTAREPVQAAGIIYDEADRLNRMVTQLTDLARVQAGHLSMHMQALDVSQIVRAVAQKLAVVAEKQRVELNIDAPPMPSIAADGDRLVQVFNNLVGNAIKYTPPGGQVTVRTHINDSGVEVTVQDTGIGIPRADLPRIFERFYQVDKARGPKRGTGLGLAITREIVQAHGGRIDVESTVGQGTTFTVWFPSPDLSTVVRGR